MRRTGMAAGTRPRWRPGWRAALDKASNAAFGKPVAFMGEGGSIPFMAMLGKKFPKTQFVVTGVLGPHSNAHGPNEFLHIPTAKKVAASHRIHPGRSRVAGKMSFLDSADDDPKRAARRPLLFFLLVTLAVGAAGQRLHRAQHPHLVCGAGPSHIRAAQLGVRAGLDHALCPDGGGGLAGMARGRHHAASRWAPTRLQLLFNFAWSVIFFALHQIGLALAEIGLSADLLILATTILFWRRDRLAGLLLLPYLGLDRCFAGGR